MVLICITALPRQGAAATNVTTEGRAAVAIKCTQMAPKQNMPYILLKKFAF